MTGSEDSPSLPIPLGPASLVDEVRDFIASLKSDLPDLFPPRALPARGRAIPFRGEELRLTVRRDPGCARAALTEEGHELSILLPPDGPTRAGDLLNEWYREKARLIFTESVERWSREMGLGYSRIQIKDQRTLWGSCSREGSLNFNWRVVMAPPAVLDYLVIHELAHLREMNHSRRFWGHVAAFCPDWKERRRWLREHSRELKRRLRRAS